METSTNKHKQTSINHSITVFKLPRHEEELTCSRTRLHMSDDRIDQRHINAYFQDLCSRDKISAVFTQRGKTIARNCASNKRTVNKKSQITQRTRKHANDNNHNNDNNNTTATTTTQPGQKTLCWVLPRCGALADKCLLPNYSPRFNEACTVKRLLVCMHQRYTLLTAIGTAEDPV